MEEALFLFRKTIELDPDFALAHAFVARCYSLRIFNGWSANVPQDSDDMRRFALRATELGKDDAVALCYAGFALARGIGDFEGGIPQIDRALVLNPNLAMAWTFSGIVRAHLGQPKLAIEHLTTAMRLSPLDPNLGSMQAGAALAYFVDQRYDEAAEWAERAVASQPKFLPAIRNAVVSNSLAGRMERARAALTRARELDPAFRISNLYSRTPLQRPEDLARYAEGLRKAGLPE